MTTTLEKPMENLTLDQRGVKRKFEEVEQDWSDRVKAFHTILLPKNESENESENVEDDDDDSAEALDWYYKEAVPDNDYDHEQDIIQQEDFENQQRMINGMIQTNPDEFYELMKTLNGNYDDDDDDDYWLKQQEYLAAKAEKWADF